MRIDRAPVVKVGDQPWTRAQFVRQKKIEMDR